MAGTIGIRGTWNLIVQVYHDGPDFVRLHKGLVSLFTERHFVVDVPNGAHLKLRQPGISRGKWHAPDYAHRGCEKTEWKAGEFRGEANSPPGQCAVVGAKR